VGTLGFSPAGSSNVQSGSTDADACTSHPSILRLRLRAGSAITDIRASREDIFDVATSGLSKPGVTPSKPAWLIPLKASPVRAAHIHLLREEAANAEVPSQALESARFHL